jgi:hypothetical protein
VIHSRLSKKEAVGKLKENVTDTHPLNPSFPDKDFTGSVYHSDFRVREIMGYRTGGLPVFHGVLEESRDGVAVHVKASNTAGTLGALLCWGLSVGLVVKGVSMMLLRQPDLGGLFLVIVGLLSAGVALFLSWLFEKKIETGRKWLMALLEGIELANRERAS